MASNNVKTTSTSNEQDRARQVYEYAKKRSEEIQKGIKKPVPIDVSKKR